ncbi:hypothetical protein MANES_17G038905v8 [Manihot esculenta]|uniref:Uncharacterized protein n=1 Tax=Manihot esculenta TaxID=3983 RepID=A0ACB7G2T1_MANES|nr:hypothetical protein MANES_17G038905v8 [Manihot esculenta]
MVRSTPLAIPLVIELSVPIRSASVSASVALLSEICAGGGSWSGTVGGWLKLGVTRQEVETEMNHDLVSPHDPSSTRSGSGCLDAEEGAIVALSAASWAGSDG